MSILYFMIPMGILIVIGALWAFFWAVDNGQFDDLESPSWRILLDDDTQPPAPPAGRAAGSDSDSDSDRHRERDKTKDKEDRPQ